MYPLSSCHSASPQTSNPTQLFLFPWQLMPSQTFAQKHTLFPETLSLTLLSLLLLVIWVSSNDMSSEDFSIFPFYRLDYGSSYVLSMYLHSRFYFPHCTIIIALCSWPLVLLLPWGWTPYLFLPTPHAPTTTLQLSRAELSTMTATDHIFYWSSERWLVRIEMSVKYIEFKALDE